MEQTFKAAEVNVGFHSDAYRIDKTAAPMNRYTKWEILPGNQWRNPKPVCFDSLPQQGWFEKLLSSFAAGHSSSSTSQGNGSCPTGTCPLS